MFIERQLGGSLSVSVEIFEPGRAVAGSQATVAVIMPTYNHAHFLAEAIRSVLAQTHPADEIIVVDDGSTDDPASVVARFPTVRLIRQDNRGLAAARNTGLWNSNSSYLVFLDADDRLLPRALQAGLTCILSRPDCAFVYGGYRLVSENRECVRVVCPTPMYEEPYLAILRRDTVLGIMTMLYRRDCLLAVNGFDESLRACEDLDLKLRITRTYPIAAHPEIIAEYRRHDQNMTNNYIRILDTALLVLKRHDVASDPIIHTAIKEGLANRRVYYISKLLQGASARWRGDIGGVVRDLMRAARRSPILTARTVLRFIGSRIPRIAPLQILGITKDKNKSELTGRLTFNVQRIWSYEQRPLILMYHRIADEPVDHFEMAVSPKHFEEHLDVLRRLRRPLPLSEFVHQMISGTLPSDAVALTFDDGYVDNLLIGKPLLAAADVAATVFFLTGYVDRPQELWWDELAQLILLENGSQTFELTVRQDSMRFDFGAEPLAHEDGATPAASLARRRAALSALWHELRVLEDEERQSVMHKLRSILASRDHRAGLSRVMTGEELRAITSDGLVTIGAHTITHPVLMGLGAGVCRREITESKLACEVLLGKPVVAFAYPYGEFDRVSREMVKGAGFAFACSTQPAPVTAGSDLFALPRVRIPNVSGDTFERLLRLTSTPA